MTESLIEQAALAWLESLGWSVKHGAEIAPGERAAERADFNQVILTQRLQDALAQLNPLLPAEALNDAFRKLTRPEGPTLEARNRALHRLLVDGVTVEYRTVDGAIRGAQAWILDFDDPGNNDWLAVNQFTISEHQHTRRPDVVLFVNGLPLALIELKNAAGRGHHHLVGFPATPDLSGGATDAVRLQCHAGRLRRRRGTHRNAHPRP